MADVSSQVCNRDIVTGRKRVSHQTIFGLFADCILSEIFVRLFSEGIVFNCVIYKMFSASGDPSKIDYELTIRSMGLPRLLALNVGVSLLAVDGERS